VQEIVSFKVCNEINIFFSVSKRRKVKQNKIIEFRYAAVQSSNCFCSSFLNSNDKVDDSSCTTSCPGDSTEKCGGTARINVLDLSPVVGTICPSNAFAEQGSLCCPERSSFRLIDQSFLDLVVYIFLFNYLFYFEGKN